MEHIVMKTVINTFMNTVSVMSVFIASIDHCDLVLWPGPPQISSGLSSSALRVLDHRQAMGKLKTDLSTRRRMGSFLGHWDTLHLRVLSYHLNF